MMPFHGVEVDCGIANKHLLDRLWTDHLDRYAPPPKSMFVLPFQEKDRWVSLDSTYFDAIRLRYRILLSHHDYVIDRLEGDDVKLAERELRDAVVDYVLKEYPDYFRREGNIVHSALTGLKIDVSEGGADPLVAVALLASEDMVMMMPAETNERGDVNYRLKSGALLFPSGWSLRSKFNKPEPDKANTAAWAAWEKEREESLRVARLGKTLTEIHIPAVEHYKPFELGSEKLMRTIAAGEFMQRRNWLLHLDDQLFRHADCEVPPLPPLTPESWQMLGHLRVEQETFRRLPESQAVVFGIKTYLWRFSDVFNNEAAFQAVATANHKMTMGMISYQERKIRSFREYLELCRKAKGMESVPPINEPAASPPGLRPGHP